MNKVYCVAPFVHLYATPSEEQERMCCTAEPHSKNSEWDLEKRWTSEKYKDLRKQMLDSPDKPTAELEKLCKRCIDKEASGDVSDRNLLNQTYDDISLNVETGNEYGTSIDLDLRPGNLCNLQCRMCWTGASSQLEKEVRNNFKELWFMGPPKVNISDWSSDENMDFMLRNVDKGKRIKFLGGEPTIMPEVHKILDLLIDKGMTSIPLSITTNLTNVNKNFMNRLAKFDCISFNYSIDGLGSVVEYIRHPVKWDMIKKNILEYEKVATSSTINYTLQAYNLHNLKDFVDWANSINVNYNINMVTHPEWDSVYVLPVEYRTRYLKNININAAKHILKNDTEYSIINFIRHTKLLDKVRNQHIKDYIPEVWELIQEDYDALQI